MIRKMVAALGVAAMVTRTPAAAQNAECAAYSLVAQTYNVCNAAIDATRAFHPVAGLLMSGGNPVLGTAKTLGGLPHLSITARVNAVRVVTPSLTYTGGTGTVPQGDRVIVPAPLVEGAVGVWPGLPNGLLSVDALGSAQLLPTGAIADLQVDPDARKIGDIALGLGYGARVGILRGGFPTPSVSVSVMRRDLPTIRYGTVTASNTQNFSYAVGVHATNYRLTASTNLVLLSLTGGVGIDRYTGDAVIVFRDPVSSLPQPPIAIALDNTRTMAFLNAGFDGPVVKVVGEIGYQGGKDQKLTTDFQGFDPAAGKVFGGVGVRFSF